MRRAIRCDSGVQAGRFESQGADGGIYANSREFAQVLREKVTPRVFTPGSSGHDYAAWVEALVAGMRDFTGLEVTGRQGEQNARQR